MLQYLFIFKVQCQLCLANFVLKPITDIFYSITDVIYVSAAGSMLCQIVNSLLLLPVSVARPLLSYLLDLLPPLDRLNRLLPAAVLLEDQELQWPLHGKNVVIILRKMDFMNLG